MSDDAQVKGTASFIQHEVPGFQAGEYQLAFDQDLTLPTHGTESFSSEYTFAVRGERFALAPTEVHSVFPPNNSKGEYGHVLPSIVFTKKTLPWIRSALRTAPDEGYLTMDDGTVYDREVATWLGVMTFDDADAAAFPGFSPEPRSGTLADLNGSRPDGRVASYFTETTGTTVDHLEPGQRWTDPCRYLDVPVDLFLDIAPSVLDLEVMAHVREVEIERKPIEPTINYGSTTHSFSTVLGNRLPSTGTRTTAVLVSLEQLAPFLPTTKAVEAGSGEAPVSRPEIDAEWIRLAVLHSWSFESIGDPNGFVDQLRSLNGTAPISDDDVPTLAGPVTLRHPSPMDDALVDEHLTKALHMGYTPMPHTARTGEETVSWYRGPFSPYHVEGEAIALPAGSSDALLQLDPETAMFDVSYAAAWQLGRLLALRDRGFATAQYQWKRASSEQLITAIEAAVIGEQFDEVLRHVEQIEELTDARGLLHTAMGLIAGHGEGGN